MLRTYAEKSDCDFHLFRLRPRFLSGAYLENYIIVHILGVFLRSLQCDFAISVWLLDTFRAFLRGTVYDDQSLASIVVGALLDHSFGCAPFASIPAYYHLFA